MPPLVAIIAPGAMGSAIAARLTRHGVTVLTSLEGRSPASRARAEAAGMRAVGDAGIVAQADIILSIVPPADAAEVAGRFAAALDRTPGHHPVFADCNAIGVDTVIALGRRLDAAGARFVDGGIIGLPPEGEDAGPTLHVCGPAAGEIAVLGGFGLTIRVMDGPIGAASTLKLSYAGITKGLTAVAVAMILAAERAGAGAALKQELAASQPQLLSRFTRTLPDMVPKAGRWVAEMQAIAGFIGPSFPEAALFEAAAGLYARLAADDTDVRRLDDFLGRQP